MKNLIRIGAFTFCLLFILSQAQAQQQPLFTSYMFNHLAINPAYAGHHTDGVELTGLYRTQWAKVDGPSTQTITGHSRIGDSKSGIGGQIMNDKNGITRQTAMYVDYAYHLPLRSNSQGLSDLNLSFGLQAGAFIFSNNYADLQISKDSSGQFTSAIGNKPNFSKTNFNVGFGLYLYGKNGYFGISAPMVIENEVENNDGIINNLNRHYFVSAGYLFPINNTVKLRPTALLKLVSGAPIQYDVNLMAIFVERFWAGVSYRSSSTLAFLAQINITNKLRLGYAYDLNKAEVRSQFGAGHEIMLNLLINRKFIYMENPRYF